VFVILPAFATGPAYATIKKVAETQVGLLTQCIQPKNVYKCQAATVANLLLKINSKLGGTNNYIERSVRPELFNKPIIIFGADVTHPTPESRETSPSVAAVCGSLDPKVSQFVTKIRVQKGGVEIIQDLENIIYEMLMVFYKRSNHAYKPQRILFFRDGVSDGQFEQVMRYEIQAIRKACSRLEDGYEPPITFLVVQKRHHTRFFPTNPKDESGRSRNVPPGTIVDHTITFKPEMNFYMVSHQGIQGTSRPTKYHVLWDDNNLSPDDIEIITYYLCHTFVRCTRSVSYPAPTYYAHLAAFRGRMYVDKLAQTRQLDIRQLHRIAETIAIKDELTERNPMHYV